MHVRASPLLMWRHVRPSQVKGLTAGGSSACAGVVAADAAPCQVSRLASMAATSDDGNTGMDDFMWVDAKSTFLT